jgi:hypothetical protein
MIGAFNMIRFKNKITIDQRRAGDWFIETDRGDQYEMLQLTNRGHVFTEWWNMQHQSELRHWQMDLFLRELTRRGHSDDFVIWTVYKKGQGHSQPHDIAVMYHQGMRLWVLSTQEYHWLMPGALQANEFHKDLAIEADLCSQQDRREIYPLTDFLNKHYETAICES